MQQVKPEHTGWRDLKLSQRHRMWGVGCPCIDLDFVLLEYDYGTPVALVEYKREMAPVQNGNAPGYRALRVLGTNSAIPVFAVRYEPTWTRWKVFPLNEYARTVVPVATTMTERDWVTLLYKLRRVALPQGLFAGEYVRQEMQA